MGYDIVNAGRSPWLAREIDDPRVSVGEHTFYDGPITLGLWSELDRIEIGRFSWIARDVVIFGGGNHAARTVSSFDFEHVFGAEGATPNRQALARPTRIGNDVWLGFGVTVLPGAEIGDGAMIGARAVVAGKVPPYTVYAGNPARLVKRRFREDTIERLMAARWWNWELEDIRAALPRLHSDPDAWSSDETFAPLKRALEATASPPVRKGAAVAGRGHCPVETSASESAGQTGRASSQGSAMVKSELKRSCEAD